MKINLAVTIDVDNDDMALADERNRLSWTGLSIIPDIRNTLEKFGLPATWFVRADRQLREVYGSASYLLEKEAQMWRQLVAAGDEIGWHPHVYHLNRRQEWETERDDESFARQLVEIHEDLALRGFNHDSVRIGEACGSNSIAHALAQLGLIADSSAIPGRRRVDGSRVFDWEPTPNHPYFPGRGDYRRPTEDRLPILEVPMTTAPVTASYDRAPLCRYLNLTYHPEIFSAAMRAYVAEVGNDASVGYLTVILHPDELIAGRKEHGLYAFTFEAVRSNLQTILHVTEESGAYINGARIGDIARSFLEAR
jgi:hypothetical protein